MESIPEDPIKECCICGKKHVDIRNGPVFMEIITVQVKGGSKLPSRSDGLSHRYVKEQHSYYAGHSCFQRVIHDN